MAQPRDRCSEKSRRRVSKSWGATLSAILGSKWTRSSGRLERRRWWWKSSSDRRYRLVQHRPISRVEYLTRAREPMQILPSDWDCYHLQSPATSWVREALRRVTLCDESVAQLPGCSSGVGLWPSLKRCTIWEIEITDSGRTRGEAMRKSIRKGKSSWRRDEHDLLWCLAKLGRDKIRVHGCYLHQRERKLFRSRGGERPGDVFVLSWLSFCGRRMDCRGRDGATKKKKRKMRERA